MVRQNTPVTASKSFNRRSFLKGSSVATIGTGLSGCLGSVGGGGESLYVGGLYPLSGPYGGPGKKMQQGVEVAVELARENIDMEIEFEDADTKADPATGRKAAQELINDGADLLIGTYSASVEKSVVDLANNNEVITATFGVDPSFFGEACNLYHFSPASPIWKQDHAVLGHALREGWGESVYTISANYVWGQTHQRYVEETVAPKYDAEYKGNTFTQLGQSDFSQALTEARDSGADIIYSPTAGGDLVKLANQASEFGMYEDFTFMWPVGGLTVIEQINPDIRTNENFNVGLGWYWKLDTPATKTFIDAYDEQTDGEVPSWPSAILYAALRTLLDSAATVGEWNAKDVAKETQGKKLSEQLWGRDEYFRKCNNSNIFPYYIARGKQDPSGNDVYEIMATIDDYKEIYRDCSETGCNMGK